MAKVTAYCICGGSLNGMVKPDTKAQKWLDKFWEAHSGDGHAPCDQRTAANARAREEYELSAPRQDLRRFS